MDPEPNKPKRQRYILDKGIPAEVDPTTYIKNLTTERAISIHVGKMPYTFEIWFDKHLRDRQQHGDTSGQRLGIGDTDILKLLQASLSHIVYYSLNVSSFSVLGSNNRVCLRSHITEGMAPLNIICEIHSKDIQSSLYEITVVTAMCISDFRVKDNQFSVELFQDDNSVLTKFYRGNFNEICSI